MLGLHRISVHGHIVILLVRALHFGCFTSPLVLAQCLQQTPYLLQMPLDALDVAEHIADIPLCR